MVVLLACLSYDLQQQYKKWCVCAPSCPALCNPLDYSPPGIALGFPRQEYWSELPFPTAGNPDPGIELASRASPALQANSLPTEPPGEPRQYKKDKEFIELLMELERESFFLYKGAVTVLHNTWMSSINSSPRQKI